MIIFTPNTVIRSTEVNSNFDDSVDLSKHTNPYKFHAYNTTTQIPSGATWTKMAMGTEVYDTNNNFASNVYTAPVSGFYHFGVRCLFFSQNGTPVLIAIGKNWTSGAPLVRLGEIPNCGGNTTLCGSVDIQLSAGDTVCALAYTNGSSQLGNAYEYNGFWGHFISL